MPVTTVRFTDDVAEELRRFAHIESLKTGDDISVSHLVRDAITDYLNKHKCRRPTTGTTWSDIDE